MPPSWIAIWILDPGAKDGGAVEIISIFPSFTSLPPLPSLIAHVFLLTPAPSAIFPAAQPPQLPSPSALARPHYKPLPSPFEVAEKWHIIFNRFLRRLQ